MQSESAHLNTSDSVAQKLTRIAEYILLIAFGILPILFIPGLAVSLAYTKVAIVCAAVLAAVVLSSFVLLRAGRLSLYVPRALIAFGVFFVIAVAAAILSGDARDALVGSAFEVHTAGFVGLLFLTMLVWMSIRNKVAVMRLYGLLLVSAILLAIFHITRVIFGPEFLSLGLFGGSSVLSPVGAWNNLAIFFGLITVLILLAFTQLPLSRLLRTTLMAVLAASLVILAVVNLFSVWVVLAVVSLVALVYGLARDRFTTPQPDVLPRTTGASALVSAFAVFFVSALFVVGGSVVGSVVSNATNISYVEVRPSFQATTDVLTDVYREQALFGIGPNRFSDAWRLYREHGINETIFWATDFQAGFGYVPTLFVTTGLLGGIAFIGFLAFFVIAGVRFMLAAPATDRVWYFIGLSGLAGGAYVWAIAFVYVPGAVLLLLAAMSTGLLCAAHAALAPSYAPVRTIGHSPRTNFLLVALAVVAVGGSIGVAYGIGQHYLATYYYGKGLVAYQEAGDIATAGELTAQAFTFHEDDLYARRIAEYESLRLANVLAGQGGTPEELQAQFQQIFNNGVGAARVATELDPRDADNWSVLGGFYSAVMQLNIEGIYEQATAALVRARELDPQNPARVLALAQLELLNNNAEEARRLAGEALRLKSNYSEAIYMLAQLDILAGNIDAAIATTRSVVNLEPQNPVRHFQLGVLELSNENPAAAAQSFERAVALNQDYANARYFLAFAYDALGRPQDAQTQLAYVLSLNPGNQNVLALLEQLDNGGSLAALNTATGTPAATVTPPVNETADAPAADDTAVSGEDVPDSPLLSPANVGTETDGAIEE